MGVNKSNIAQSSFFVPLKIDNNDGWQLPLYSYKMPASKGFQKKLQSLAIIIQVKIYAPKRGLINGYRVTSFTFGYIFVQVNYGHDMIC